MLSYLLTSGSSIYRSEVYFKFFSLYNLIKLYLNLEMPVVSEALHNEHAGESANSNPEVIGLCNNFGTHY